MLVCGLVVMKLRSFRDATLKVKPRNLLVRKMELRTSELMASPKGSAKAKRNVSEESSLTAATKRQLSPNRDCIANCYSCPPSFSPPIAPQSLYYIYAFS